MGQRDKVLLSKKFLVSYKMNVTKFYDPIVVQFKNSKNVDGPVYAALKIELVTDRFETAEPFKNKLVISFRI